MPLPVRLMIIFSALAPLRYALRHTLITFYVSYARIRYLSSDELLRDLR